MVERKRIKVTEPVKPEPSDPVKTKAGKEEIIIQRLEARLFETNQARITAAIDANVTKAMENFVPAIKWRIEERLDRAAAEVKGMGQELSRALGAKLEEVDQHLDAKHLHEELTTKRLDELKTGVLLQLAEFRSSVEDFMREVRASICELEAASKTRAINSLHVERLTFWQLLGAVGVGACAVAAGHLVANNRHDKVVRDALIDASGYY